MPRPEAPPQLSMGPQAFKQTLHGNTETGWLTVFYTPSRQTLWFHASEPMPDLDLNQNCYLGLGVRRRHPHNGRTRGKNHDVIAIPGLWLDLDYDSPAPTKSDTPCLPMKTPPCPCSMQLPTSLRSS